MLLIAALLHQDVHDDAVLVDGPPQPLALAFDLELHLVQLPFVTRLRTTPVQAGSTARAKLGASGADRLVGDSHSPFGQRFLDIAQTQMEAEVQPGRSTARLMISTG